MSLKINLKPNEAVYVGVSRVTVMSEGNVTLLIDGDTPVLRAKEHIGEPPREDVAARLRYVVQQMYLAQDIASFQEEYFALAQELTGDSAERAEHVARTNAFLIQGEFYKALKQTRFLMEGEAPVAPRTATRAR